MENEIDIFANLQKYNIVLCSKSPRRQQLLRNTGLCFTVDTSMQVEEKYPQHLKNEEVAMYLAKLKAAPYTKNIQANTIIITCDTIVCLDNEILTKPNDAQHAFSILRKLSNNEHAVISGVCLVWKDDQTVKQSVFYSKTKVLFKQLTDDEIHYYINNYKPYDKAGAYGIQEWIGLTGIKKIKGSYFNVVGLPVQMLYKELMKIK